MLKGYSKLYSSVILVAVYLSAFLVVCCLFPLFTFSHVLIAILVADISGTLVIFIFSMIFSNSSVYDPYWSVAPPIIVIYLVSHFPQGNHFRQGILVILVLFWSIRLTLNWFRGWQGLRHQDWRYTSIAGKTGNWYWPVSLLGIHLMPTLLVFLGCLPLWYALSSNAPFNVYDIPAMLITLSAILTEWIADEQLRKFRKRNPKDAFIRSGLWNYSRHPNYLGEIGFWVGIFLFFVSSVRWGSLAGYWTAIGMVSIFMLFKFISVPLMERRNRLRKAGYAEYMNQVPALWPRISPAKRLSAKKPGSFNEVDDSQKDHEQGGMEC